MTPESLVHICVSRGKAWNGGAVGNHLHGAAPLFTSKSTEEIVIVPIETLV